MSAKNFRFVLIGLIGISLVLASLVSYFGVTFLGQKVREADHVKIEAEVNESARASAEHTERQFEDERVERLHKYLAEIIPEASYKDQIIADIKKYADDSKVPLTALTFGGATSGSVAAPKIDGATAVPISITLGTDIPYNNFIKFVEKLENNLQHIQVISFDIQPFALNPKLLTSANLAIAIYVEK